MKFEGIDVRRAMVVYAHPDDAEFGVAGTVAKWARAGVEITYCMVTNGASGSDDPEMTRERLRDVRYAEQRAAAKVLGVKHTVFLGYEDGYLYPTLEVRRDVARQIRIHKPDALIAQDPTMRVAGEFYVNHPDHIAAGEVALRSVNPDASTRQMFPELWRDEKLEPHKPKLLMLEAFAGAGTVIDISDTLEIKIAALREHRSQLGPEAEALIRDFARRAGAAAGYRAGETFRLIRLERLPDGETPALGGGAKRGGSLTNRGVPEKRGGSLTRRGAPAKRDASPTRRGVQAKRRTSTRRPAKTTPSRRKRSR